MHTSRNATTLKLTDPTGYTMFHLESTYEFISDPVAFYYAQNYYFSQFPTFTSNGGGRSWFSNRPNKPAYSYDWDNNCYVDAFGNAVSYNEVFCNYISKYAGFYIPVIGNDDKNENSLSLDEIAEVCGINIGGYGMAYKLPEKQGNQKKRKDNSTY